MRKAFRMDAIQAEQAPTQALSCDENSWVADRIPARLDAARAHRPLDQSFVQSFKHAILTDTVDDVQYLNDASEAALLSSQVQQIHVPFPLSFANVFPEVPPLDKIQELVTKFRSCALLDMRLVSLVPYQSSTAIPDYLTYAMATMGAIATGNDLTLAYALWTTSNILIATTLEIDNREARKTSLINAWILQASYGSLCSDWPSWQQTKIHHGYVETAARRLRIKASWHASWAAMPALLLSDILIAVHYHQTSTIQTFECLANPTPINTAAVKIYKAILSSGDIKPPAPEPVSSSSFLALVALLVDIHNLTDVFEPLQSAHSGSSTTRSQPTGFQTFHNPYLPFSLANENRLLRRRLLKALDAWAESYYQLSSSDTLVMYYFCRMYVSLSTIQGLPTLANYPPRLASGGPLSSYQQHLIDNELREAPDAQQSAWRILEHVKHESKITPTWLPIAVFYASLVIWRAVVLQVDSGLHGSQKVLVLFREELQKMSWPCSKTMAATLNALLI